MGRPPEQIAVHAAVLLVWAVVGAAVLTLDDVGALPIALWGLSGAVTSSLNQASSPGVRRERNHQTKLALHLTKGALKVGRISASQAERLWGIALTKPDNAIEELSSSRTGPESNGPSV